VKTAQFLVQPHCVQLRKIRQAAVHDPARRVDLALDGRARAVAHAVNRRDRGLAHRLNPVVDRPAAAAQPLRDRALLRPCSNTRFPFGTRPPPSGSATLNEGLWPKPRPIHGAPSAQRSPATSAQFTAAANGKAGLIPASMPSIPLQGLSRSLGDLRGPSLAPRTSVAPAAIARAQAQGHV
jgi:hypothetical protein